MNSKNLEFVTIRGGRVLSFHGEDGSKLELPEGTKFECGVRLRGGMLVRKTNAVVRPEDLPPEGMELKIQSTPAESNNNPA